MGEVVKERTRIF